MRRLLLTGYFDRGNFGDDLMHEALTGFLKQYHPEVSVDSRPLPQFHPKSLRIVPAFLRAMQWSDAVALAGGSHFHDGYGLRSYRLLLTFAGLFLLAKLMRKRILLIGIGIGPLSSWISRLITKAILLTADVILVRDLESAAVAHDLLPSGKVIEGIDLAGLLPSDHSETQCYDACTDGPLRIGVSIMPYFRSYRNKPSLDEAFIDACCAALQSAAATRSILDITLLVFSVKGSDADTGIVHRLEHKLAEGSERTTVRTVVCQDLRNTLTVFRSLDLVIASRYHAVWLSYIARRPTIIVAYHDKCSSLAQQLNFAEASLVTPEQVLSGQLEEALRFAAARPEAFISPVSPCDVEKQAHSALTLALSEATSSRA